MRSSPSQFLFLVLIIGIVLMRESRIPPVSNWDLNFASWLSINSPRKPEPAPVTLVQITNDDISSTPWPWSPLDFSLFLNAAIPFQPPVLAIEPVLNWEMATPQQLNLLHNQLLKSPKVLLGSKLGFPDDPSVVPPLQEVPVLRFVGGDISNISEFTLVAHQPAEELRLAATLGFQNYFTNENMPVRRVPMVFRYCGQVVPSFTLQAAMLWFGVTPDEVTVIPGRHIKLGKAEDSLKIPIDPQGAMMVNFSVPITRFSFGDLLLSAEQNQAGSRTIAPVARIKNSLTMLARTDNEASELRLANGRQGSLGEFFAFAIATLQSGEFIKKAPITIEFLIIMEALIMAWLCTRLTKLASFALCLLVSSVYVVVALGVFSQTLVALPLVLPTLLIGFVGLFRLLD